MYQSVVRRETVVMGQGSLPHEISGKGDGVIALQGGGHSGAPQHGGCIDAAIVGLGLVAPQICKEGNGDVGEQVRHLPGLQTVVEGTDLKIEFATEAEEHLEIVNLIGVHVELDLIPQQGHQDI